MTPRGFHSQHDPKDPADVLTHRAMEAIKRAMVMEFGLDKESPNVTVVVSVPPDGRVGVASTEPTPELVLLALKMGWGAAKHAERLGL